MSHIRAILPVFPITVGMADPRGQLCRRLVGSALHLDIPLHERAGRFHRALSYAHASQNIVVKIVEPGGGDTAFHARSSKLNTGDGGLDSYGPFLERANAALGKLAKGTRCN